MSMEKNKHILVADGNEAAAYVAYAFYLSYHIAAAVFLGSLLGKVGYAVMERVQTRKRNKEE